jgi:hypothetical protein
VARQERDQVGQLRGGVVEEPVGAVRLMVVRGHGGQEAGQVVDGDHRDERAPGAGQRREASGPQLPHQAGQAEILPGLAGDRVPDHGGGVDHGQRDPLLGGEGAHRRVALALRRLVRAVAPVELGQLVLVGGVGQRLGDPVAGDVDQAPQVRARTGPAQDVQGAVDVGTLGLVPAHPEAVGAGGVEDIPYGVQPVPSAGRAGGVGADDGERLFVHVVVAQPGA